MKAWTIAGGALVLMSGMGIAMAQQAPPAPPPGAAAPAAAQPGGPGAPGMDGNGPRGPMDGRMGGPGFGPGGWRHHGMRDMPPPPPPSKAAHFRLRKEGGMIDVKCAENETMKACVDAANLLLDKAAAQK